MRSRECRSRERGPDKAAARRQQETLSGIEGEGWRWRRRVSESERVRVSERDTEREKRERERRERERREKREREREREREKERERASVQPSKEEAVNIMLKPVCSDFSNVLCARGRSIYIYIYICIDFSCCGV